MKNEIILQSNLVPHFTHVVKRLCTTNWKIGKGTIDVYNIIFVFEGSAYIECNNKKYKLQKGDFFCFKPGDLRYGYTFKDNLMKCYAVNFLYSCPEYKNGKWNFKKIQLPLKHLNHINDSYVYKKLITHFETLINNYVSDNDKKLVICNSEFKEIINLAIFWQQNNNIDYFKLKKVDKAISIMTSNLEKKITLEDISQKLNISKSYFCKIFKEVTGKSPIEYYINVKINKAKSYLKDSFSVSETAKLTGFSDVYYFSKCFKKITGISPSKYY